ncbi:MAG TPA: 4Fe-4S single cluster domain-containing protein [Kofleriaceae bacterium]|nr:4Fe-4S single cluster domain-containing protein [Kofleriaceae bacterium]
MTRLRVHAFEPRSRANGPGTRAVVWVQGCSLGCPGCFNPATWPAAGGREMEIDEIAGAIRAAGGDGVTVSGGEPFEQPEGLLALVTALAGTSIIVFSGFTRGEIERQPLGPAILERIDVLVDGRYVEKRRVARGLRGSANQVVHLLTPRHRRADIESTPVGEVVIGPDGEVRVSGVDPPGVPGVIDH